MQNRIARKKFPRYAKYFYILASTILTIYVIILARPIINPMLLAFFIAVLLKPVSSYLEKIYFPRLLSSLITTALFLVIIFSLTASFLYQMTNITTALPSYDFVLSEFMQKSQKWMAYTLGISSYDFINFLKQSLSAFLRSGTQYFSSIVSGTANFFTNFFLFVISLFFFLYYRNFFIAFIFKIFSRLRNQKVAATLQKINQTILQYIVGIFIIMLIIAILNSLGLYLLGVDYAVFFGVLAAVLTIIPYLGIVIGSLLPTLYVLITTGSFWLALSVVLLFAVIQLLEGNLITPNIVGSRVNINPFIAILALLFGGMLLGATGIILAIPIVGIFKIICDEITSLQPIGFLIGLPKTPVNIFMPIWNYIVRKTK